METVQILARLANHDILVGLNGNKLAVTAPKGSMTQELAALIAKNKPAIMAYLQQQSDTKQVSLPAIEARHDATQRAFPLSFSQRRLWLVEQITEHSAQNNIPMAFKVNGPFDLLLAKSAMAHIVQRHEVLRTVYRHKNDDPVQVVIDDFDLPFFSVDLQHLKGDELRLKIQKYCQKDAAQAFDLSGDLMIRAGWLQCPTVDGKAQGILLFNMHHIASDGWSLGILMREFVTFYDAGRTGKQTGLQSLTIQYADYANWQQQHLGEQALAAQLDYWQSQLVDSPSVHSLPLDHERPVHTSYEGDLYDVSLPESLAQQLLSLAKTEQVTPFMLMHGAFSLLMARLSQNSDILIGTPVANRRHSAVNPLIGFFVNTLVLRTQVDKSLTFGQYLEQVKKVNLDAQSNQDVPFEQVLEHCDVSRSQQYSPLFQVMLTMNNNEQSNDSPAELDFQQLPNQHAAEKFDLTLRARLDEVGCSLSWSFKTALFDKASIVRFHQHFVTLLHNILASPEAPVTQISYLSAQQHSLALGIKGEVRDFLQEYSQEHSQEHLLHQLFEQQVDKTPDAIALQNVEQTLTYQQLDSIANQLAHFIKEQGVGAQTLVGLCFPRVVDVVIAQLAVLKAGGAFIVLEPGQPMARINGILNEHQIKLVLVHNDTQALFADGCPEKSSPEKGERKIFNLRELFATHEGQKFPQAQSLLAHCSTKRIEFDGLTAQPLAYVVFTSGSTGKPKGVMIEHRAWINQAYAMEAFLLSKGPKIWGWYASFAFDGAIKGLSALCLGCGLDVLSDDMRKDPQALVKYFRDNPVDIMDCTPAFIELLLQQNDLQLLPDLVIGGDTISVRLWDELIHWQQKHQKSAWNVYGPSENTINTSWTRIEGDKPNIGKLLPNQQAYVVDKFGQLLPTGLMGELYVGGRGLARGYLHSPEQTAQRFIPHPFGGEGRLYRTGDLVKCSAIGQLEYLGRCDEQVKIRGFRIELEEVAVQLGQCMGVQSCEVLARALGEDSHSLTLVGYVVCDELTREGLTPENEGAYCQQLRRALEGHLPDYMVPSHIVLLASWPLTHNGKIDRRRLPLPQLSQDGYQAPSNEAEASMQRLWSELLGHRAEDMSVTGSFFDYGGHSLLAVRLVAKIRKAFGREVPVRCVFDTPKLRALTAQVLSCPFTVVASPSKVAVRPSRLPLSYAQKRLWFIDQMDGGSAQYNMPMAFRIWGDFDVVTAEQAIKEIVGRHEILRTVYRHSEAGPQQIVREDVNVPFEVFDLSHLDGEALADETARLCHEDAVRTFDLSEDVMVRSAWLVCPPVNGEAQGVLLFNMHHIASDGVSLNILIAEFAHLYQRGHESLPNEQKHSTLPPLNLDYADFALWQDALDAERYFATHLDYWRAQLAELPEVHSLPLDHSRTQYKQSQGRSFIRHIAPEQVLRLQAIADENLVTLTMLMQTLVALMLSRQANSQDIVLGTPSANRVVGEVQDLMGCFINTLVLRLNMQQKDMPALLSHVKEVNLQALQYQEIPFEQLVDCLVSSRSTQYTPLFQVVFNMNIAAEHDLTLPGLKIAPVQSEDKQCKYDLEIHCHPAQGGLAIEWLFDVNLFELDSVEAFADHLDHIINELCHHKTTDTLSQLAQLPPAALNALKDLNKQLQRHYPDSVQIQQLFEAQVAMQPNALALADNDKQLSYAQVNGQANQLAHCLRERGIGVGDKVGICLSRSVEMVTGLLAVLKCGAAYVPLDPSYPAQRIAYMLKDASPALVLCDSQSQLLSLFKETSTQTVAIDDMSAFSGYREDNLPLVVAQDVGQLAYVIYTSGSTGEPKGVAIAHHSACQLLYWSAQTFDARQRRCMLASTSICFDLSVFELFFPLSCGGTVVVVENILSLPGLSSPGVRLEEGHSLPPISFINTVPSAMKELVRHPGLLKNIAVVALAGEPLPVTLARAVYEQGVEAVYNLYGPSEDTTYSTCYRVPRDAEQMLIGRPVANTRAYVLDSHLQPVPFGVAGELYLAGEGLAQGYLNKADLSASSFVSDPFVAGARMYRTGDLVRYCQVGELGYLGRVDEQVKIRGFRIELGEIETVLLKHSGAIEAVAMMREDRQGDNTLCAWYLAPESEKADDVRAIVSKHLPQFMVPAQIVRVDQWPLTPNGKIDKKSLPLENLTDGADENRRLPETQLQQQVAAIWRRVLGKPQIYLNDDFFATGGHSLLCVRLVQELRQQLQLSISIKDIFEKPHLGEFCDALTFASNGDVAANITLTAIARDGALPVIPAQEEAWYLQHRGAAASINNLSAEIKLQGVLALSLLEKAFNTLAQRHESLRTNFEMQGMSLHAKVVMKRKMVIDYHDVTHLEHDSLTEFKRGFADKLFDLANDCLVRIVCFKTAEQRHYLQITVHHIVADATSSNILFQELVDCFNTDPQQYRPATVQFVDFAAWYKLQERSSLSPQLRYWQKQLAKRAQPLPLPTDKGDIEMFSVGTSKTKIISLNPSQTAQLDSYCQSNKGTRFNGITSLLALYLNWRCEHSDIMIGTPYDYRSSLNMHQTIGYFVNPVCLRLKLDNVSDLSDLLTHVNETTVDALENGQIQHSTLVKSLDNDNHAAQKPLFNVWLNYVPQVVSGCLNMGKLKAQVNTQSAALLKFPFVLTVLDAGDKLQLRFDVSSELFSETRLAEIHTQFSNLLQSVLSKPKQSLIAVKTMLDAFSEQQQNQMQEQLQSARKSSLGDLSNARKSRRKSKSVA